MSPDLDYTRLQKSVRYFAGHYGSPQRIASASQRAKLPACGDSCDVSSQRGALVLAIIDFVEGTRNFCQERVLEIDRDLLKRDGYTLSFLREYFTN
jgi:hypothetical protein